MNLRGLVAGVLAGIAGAAAWAAVAYYANLEIGYLAWGIGFLVGLAVAAVGQSPGAPAGALAVAITLLSILGGKYASVDMMLRAELQKMTDAEVSLGPQDFEEDAMIGNIAYEIAEQREEAGETIAWPDYDKEDENLTAEATFPPAIWREAKQQWTSKTPDEQLQLREEASENAKAMMGAFQDQMVASARGEAFTASFGVLDLVFFGLAVATAWGIANNGSIGDD